MAECPTCHQPLAEGARFCASCGAAARPAEATEATQALPDGDATRVMEDAAGRDTTRVMPAAGSRSCPACGTLQTADNAFCRSCGAALPQAAAASLCAACGAQMLSDMAFCPSCGAPRGAVETSASAAPTVIAPGVAFRTAAQVPPTPAFAEPAPPPPPPSPPPAAVDSGGGPRRRSRAALFAVLGVVILAGAAFGVYWFVLRDTGPSTADLTRQLTPILQPVAAAQQDANTAAEGLSTEKQSFASARSAADALVAALATAKTKADGLAVDSEQAKALHDAFKSALALHAQYAEVLAKLPEDPASFTVAQADIIVTRAKSAQSAYAQLAAQAPQLPKVSITEAGQQQLATVAQQVQQSAAQQAALKAYLQQVVALFPQSQGERANAEGILQQFEDLTLPADNAAGQMQGAGADLQGVLTQVEALTPPGDQAAQEIKNLYREAVQHWVSAAQLYAKWMWGVFDYYQAQGSYPTAGGLEADTYNDPNYLSARQEQDLAQKAREKLCAAYDKAAAAVGLQADWTEIQM
jgi:RNA polymerase subunit RPABC4/transcription elongation factor Spt4